MEQDIHEIACESLFSYFLDTSIHRMEKIACFFWNVYVVDRGMQVRGSCYVQLNSPWRSHFILFKKNEKDVLSFEIACVYTCLYTT